jgi:glycerol-3-phosphate dehydrogenase
MPIVAAVMGVVRGEVTPVQMVKELMTRSLKSEAE